MVRMMEILASGVSVVEGKVGKVMRLVEIMVNGMVDGDWDGSDGDQWTCTVPRSTGTFVYD